jgi:hypothetical protein
MIREVGAILIALALRWTALPDSTVAQSFSDPRHLQTYQNRPTGNVELAVSTKGDPPGAASTPMTSASWLAW